MKKILALVLMATVLFTGCGGNVTEDKGETGEVSGTITVVTDRTDADELFDKIESQFKAKYPKVEDIVWESSADYDNYIRTRMNTEDYGDVLFVPFSMSAKPSEYADYFEPLGAVEELSERYMDTTEADYDSVAYGLPTALNSLGLLYNKAVFEKAGITEFPTSTEELIEVCKTIKEKTGAIPFYTNYNDMLGVWGGALTSYGSEAYRKDIIEKGTAFQEGQPIREIMDLFYGLAANGLIEADPITGDYGKAKQLLADGEVAMFMMGSQEVPEVEKLVTNDNEIEISPFPVTIDGDTSLAFGAPAVIGVNKNSDNKETAKAFLEFFVSDESGYADDLGGMSPDKDSLSDEEKVMLEENNVILTVPSEDPEVDELYSKIANEVGVGRLNDVLQKVINIGLYPDQNETYEEYVKSLEAKWAEAVKNNAQQ